MFALGIRFVGETTAKKLAYAFKNIDNIKNATEEELVVVDEIGTRIARSVISYFKDKRNLEQIDRLKEYGLKFEISQEQISRNTDRLQGATIVISGTFIHHSREEYKMLIEQHGGKNTGSISGKTDFLLAGSNMGPAKLEKANKLGVKIISENDFLNMIES